MLMLMPMPHDLNLLVLQQRDLRANTELGTVRRVRIVCRESKLQHKNTEHANLSLHR